MNDQKKIGAFITQARERQGISREALARRLQVAVAEIADWEAGNTYPALAQAPMLARELSVSLDELFNARYHPVAEAYQAPEALFLPDQPAPDEKEVPKKEPLAETEPQESAAPAPEERRLPRWAPLLFGFFLLIEGVAGVIWLLFDHAGAGFALFASAGIVACLAARFHRKRIYRRSQILWLAVPGFLLPLLVLIIRLLF